MEINNYISRFTIMIFILSLFIILFIFLHGEISHDKYGVISREKRNNMDYVILILIMFFYLIIYIYNLKIHRIISHITT